MRPAPARWRCDHQHRIGQLQAADAEHPSLFCNQRCRRQPDAGLAGLLAEHQIRVNAVLPGPIWTPFIPAGMAAEEVEQFGAQTPFGRPGQPAELASAYVMLASDSASYTSGALLTISGGAAHCDLMAGLPAWIEDWLTVVVPVAEVLAILGVAWVMVRVLAWLLVQAQRRQAGTRASCGPAPRRCPAAVSGGCAADTGATGRVALGAVDRADRVHGGRCGGVLCCMERVVQPVLFVPDRRHAPFRINDTIEVLESVDKPGLCGQVVDINLIYTTLSDRGEGARGCLLRVPNSLSASPATGVTAAIPSCREACQSKARCAE